MYLVLVPVMCKKCDKEAAAKKRDEKLQYDAPIFRVALPRSWGATDLRLICLLFIARARKKQKQMCFIYVEMEEEEEEKPPDGTRNKS